MTAQSILHRNSDIKAFFSNYDFYDSQERRIRPDKITDLNLHSKYLRIKIVIKNIILLHIFDQYVLKQSSFFFKYKYLINISDPD